VSGVHHEDFFFVVLAAEYILDGVNVPDQRLLVGKNFVFGEGARLCREFCSYGDFSS
jgi:hypothetical protein